MSIKFNDTKYPPLCRNFYYRYEKVAENLMSCLLTDGRVQDVIFSTAAVLTNILFRIIKHYGFDRLKLDKQLGDEEG